MSSRSDGRNPGALRPLKLIRQYTNNAPGSVLMCIGNTQVLITATVEERVPRHIHVLKDDNLGWLTAEYSMLPGATHVRTQRERQKVSGRTAEIQRLIGRTLRASIDLGHLGSRTITIDADVIQADGGTRVASITGAYVALVDCLNSLKLDGALKELPTHTQVAAISVGVVEGQPLLDLDYSEDSQADVDANVVMNGDGNLVELQMSSEKAPLQRQQLDEMLDLAQTGISRLFDLQRLALSTPLVPGEQQVTEIKHV